MDYLIMTEQLERMKMNNVLYVYVVRAEFEVHQINVNNYIGYAKILNISPKESEFTKKYPIEDVFHEVEQMRAFYDGTVF